MQDNSDQKNFECGLFFHVVRDAKKIKDRDWMENAKGEKQEYEFSCKFNLKLILVLVLYAVRMHFLLNVMDERI